MNHITFIIAKKLLTDEKAKVSKRLSSRSKITDEELSSVKREIKAIDDEIWLLNNW